MFCNIRRVTGWGSCKSLLSVQCVPSQGLTQLKWMENAWRERAPPYLLPRHETCYPQKFPERSEILEIFYLWWVEERTFQTVSANEKSPNGESSSGSHVVHPKECLWGCYSSSSIWYSRDTVHFPWMNQEHMVHCQRVNASTLMILWSRVWTHSVFRSSDATRNSVNIHLTFLQRYSRTVASQGFV